MYVISIVDLTADAVTLRRTKGTDDGSKGSSSPDMNAMNDFFMVNPQNEIMKIVKL